MGLIVHPAWWPSAGRVRTLNDLLNENDLLDLNPDITSEMARFYVKVALSRARAAAPCIVEEEFPFKDDVQAILIPAVFRWHENGPGSQQSKSVTAGPFGQVQSVDTRTFGGMSLTNAEKRDLAALCREWKGEGTRRRVFSYVPGKGVRR